MEANAPSAADLDAKEWLVIAPAAPGPFRGFGRPPDDTAQAERERSPLDVPGSLRDAGYPAIAAASSFWRVGAPLLSRPLLRYSLVLVSVLPALVWTGLNAPRPPFSGSHLALGCVAAMGGALPDLFMYLATARTRRPSRNSLGDWHPLASALRWIWLRQTMPHSVLLRHDPLDRLCPCPAASCAGRVVGSDGLARLADFAFYVSRWGLILVLLLWTPLVALAGALWTSWGAVAGVLVFVKFLLADVLTAYTRAFSIQTHPTLAFFRRIQHRALDASLRSFISSFRTFLLAGPLKSDDLIPADPSPDPNSQLHLRIHALLSIDWSHRFAYLGLIRAWLLASAALSALALALNLASGCVAAWQLALAANVLVQSSMDLATVAACNTVATDAAGLYASARLAARELLLAADRLHGSDPAMASALASLRNHADLLAELEGSISSFRAKLLGFPITYGTARAVVVAALTAAFAVWGGLRGAGVAFTLQTTCYG
ncbi:hypothetical protein DFJ74DRAFT_673690 [Hyaloraphidium curvatum]|nr:hypothetical protein DFJ74DRAFT_673690 [Hyaloraphidium curvatum]